VLILLVPNNAFKKGKEAKGLFERFFLLVLSDFIYFKSYSDAIFEATITIGIDALMVLVGGK